MAHTQPLWDDFPALHMVRVGRTMRLFGRLTFVALVLSIVSMFVLPWQQTARGTGVVVALDPQERRQFVLSPSKGVISYVSPGLREGSYIEKDELLLSLTPLAAEGVNQIDSQIYSIEAKLAAAQSSVTVAEQAEVLQESGGRNLAESLKQDFKAAHQKWEQTKNEVLVLQAELKDKQNQLRIAEEVSSKGLISRQELFSKNQNVVAQFSKVLKSENAEQEAYAMLNSKEEEIAAKKQDIDIKNREAHQKVLNERQKLNSIEKELIDLRNKRDEFNRLEVRAPRAGFIQQWLALEGSDMVREGDQLFAIVPDAASLAVELKVSGNDMPLVSEGDRVRLQFEGWPAVQFVGWPSAAVGTFGGQVNRVFPTDDGTGFFRVVVSPDYHFDGESDWPNRRYLRQGVRANGWILLNQVPLGYEIWRQLNGFPPVVASEEPKSSGDKNEKPPLPKL